MSEETPDLTTPLELPEGALLIGAIEIAVFLDRNGGTASMYNAHGMEYVTAIGWLERIKLQLDRSATFGDDDD